MNLNKPNKPQFKIKVKVTVPYANNPSKGRKEWLHFAYVDTSLYIEYLKTIGNPELSERYNVQNSIERWFKEDFNVDLSLDTYDDLAMCRRTIMESMKPEFPDLYHPDYLIDRQGWVKLWTMRHMKKDLEEYYGKQGTDE
jgi:hypothetical protein